MLRPRFRYSHDLVQMLLRSERVRVAGKSDECPSEDTLLELAGRQQTSYRHGSALIFNQARTDIIYVPPDADEVPDLMAELVEWLDEAWETVPSVIIAGVLEEELLLLQPFEHDNGTLARHAGDMVLARKGFGAIAVQAEIGKDPQSYVEASHSSHRGAFSEDADISRWLEYYASVVASAAEHVRVDAKPVAPARNGDSELYAAPLILRDRQLQALRYIRDNGAIRSGEYQRLAGIVPDTARRDFDDLMAKGLVEVRGVGRATHYLLTARGAGEAERRRSS
jgi:Fic family protein